MLGQISYLGKIWFLRYGPKCSIYVKQNDEKAWFFACWYKFIENKSWLKNLGLGELLNACAHSSNRTLS